MANLQTAEGVFVAGDNQNETIGDLPDHVPERKPCHRQMGVWLLAGMLVIGAIVAASLFLVGGNNNNRNAAPAPSTGTTMFVFKPQISTIEMAENIEDFKQVLQEYYDTLGLYWDVIEDEDSPQSKALDWTCGSATYSTLGKGRRVQRYALAVFYYSTYAQRHDYYNRKEKDSLPEIIPGWSSADKWMSNDHECEWEGIECEGQDDAWRHAITGIYLREHQLSGMLPLEMGFIGSLKQLDLTSNYIYMDGQARVTAFSHLDEVTHLLLEDNYIVTNGEGFPHTLSGMKSLERLSLSYNILQGTIHDTLFAELPALTHLEAESNYLKGSIPYSLASSESLSHLYLRRNLLEIDLHALLEPPHLPSIEALWLDSNLLTGNLPHTIGLHTGLMSLSITNTSLSGQIPTEIGDLQRLRRVWLYGNKLTGDIPDQVGYLPSLQVFEVHENELSGEMPSGLCEKIQSSTYEFKVLSADCDRVNCAHCCTKCHYDDEE